MDATNEMEQHCVINGHQYGPQLWLTYGLVIGSKTSEMTQRCEMCGHVDHRVFVPMSSDTRSFKYGKILWPF